MKIEIFPMTVDDFEEIKDTLTFHFDDFWSASVLKNELQNPNHVSSYYFVAKANSEIVGFCGVSKIVDTLEILNIVTKKDKRNLGIASQLLQYIIEEGKKKQIHTIFLEVNEHNLPARHLYEKFHFQQVGLRKNYYHHTDDAILMTLDFTKE